MSFSLGFSPFLLLVSLLGAGGLTYWMYQTAAPTVTGWQRRGLMALRFSALAVLLFLLMEPIWQRITEDEQPPVLAVLVDNTLSLSGEGRDDDAGADLPDQVRRAVEQVPSIDGELRFFSFGSALNTLPDGAGLAAEALRFDEERTNLSAGLEGVRERLRTDNLRGVVVISDGLYNTGRNPLAIAERYPHPIHTVVVGDTTQQRDVQVQRASTNDIAYVDVEQPVEAVIRATAATGESVQVSLHDGDTVLDEQSVTLPEGDGERRVTLTFTPAAEGLQQLDVVVSSIPEQVTDRNNRRTLSTQVLERRRQVVLVSGSLTPTTGAVRRALEADEDIELQSFTQRGPGGFYEGALPDTFGDVSVIVLVGFPGPATTATERAPIAAAVNDGTPVLYLHERQADLDGLADAFGDALPARPDGRSTAATSARPVLTPDGRAHPVFDGLPDALADLARLPPLPYPAADWQVSPDARLLMETDAEAPLLALRSRAGQRSAAWLGTRLWSWFTLPEELATLDALAPTMTANLIEWLATAEDDRLVRVAPTQLRFSGAEDVSFEGEVYNESLNPVPDATVQLEIEAPDGDTFPYTMRATGNGQYALDAGRLPEGAYRYTATATRDDATLGTDTGTFQIEQSALEFMQTQADAPFMRQLAARSGGTFFTPDDVAGVADAVATDDRFAPETRTLRSETPLWHLPYLLLLVVALLAAEWAWRKRAGLV